MIKLELKSLVFCLQCFYISKAIISFCHKSKVYYEPIKIYCFLNLFFNVSELFIIFDIIEEYEF